MNVLMDRVWKPKNVMHAFPEDTRAIARATKFIEHRLVAAVRRA